MKKLVVLITLAFAMVLTGCNTWHGFGKDLEKVGDKIKNSPNN